MRKNLHIGIVVFSFLILITNLSLLFLQKSSFSLNILPLNNSSSRENPTPQVLGESSAKQKEIEKEIAYWKEIVTKHPDFRDAYMKLAVLNSQINNKEETKKYLNKVLDLDPNYKPALELFQLINR